MSKFFTLRKALLLFTLLIACWSQAQTNPAPLPIPYVQNFSSFNGSTTTYPAGFQGWTVAGSLAVTYNTTGALTDFPMIATSNTNTSGFVGDMNGKMGVLSTASNMKAIGMALNTTNYTNVLVSYVAGTQRQVVTERINELGVQYRVGTTGAFTTITGSTYQNNLATANITGTTVVNPLTVSFTLPAACNNQPVVQLRWIIRDVTGSSGRPGFSIDDIAISGTGTTPVTTSLSPTSIAAGAAAFTLTVNGSNFTNQSTVTWNGANRTTTYISGSQLTAVIPATDVATQGTATVGVTTTGAPAPSNTQAFTIDAAATPTLLVTSPLADYGSLCINTAPVTHSFTLSASNLDGTDLVVAAQNGFTYSETINGTYTSVLHITYTGGGFTAKDVYVKFTPAAVQSYSGNISLSGGNISGATVPVSATGINTIPTVVTGSNLVTGTSATLQGTLSAAGCTNATAFGFEYSTTAGFANGTGISITANVSSGAFSKTVTGLAASTTYYYKAFVVNGGGTGYGAEGTFTTSSVVPVIMSAQPLLRYTENFADIAAWSANFTSGNGANHFASVGVTTTGTIPSATRISTSSAAFSTGSSGGVQKGTGTLILLSTGATDNTSSVAVDFYMDFTGVNAGTLSFDWSAVANSTGDRKGSLRVYGSTDGATFTELTAADVLNFTNNVPATGTVNNISLPASFSNSPSARLRFYYHNGSGGTVGSRPKISIDNLVVSAFASTPCATPAAAATGLVFGTITETSITGSFTAASPAANEYLVIMSTNPALTNNPLDGQNYVEGDNVGDGTVIAKGNNLNFTATDLTGATTYYFFVFSVNSVCTGGTKYLTTDVLTDDATTVAGLPSCTAPVAQPTGLSTTASINSIQGSFTGIAADEYIVLQSTASSFTGSLVNGTVYNAGATVGNAVVVQRSSATAFNATGLAPQTQYYYYIFSINSQACVNGPVYNTASPLTASATTLPLPVCSTPAAQPTDISFNSSNNSVTATFNAGGAGYNYLVIMSNAPTLSATPVDNTDYSTGTSFGGGTVVSNGTSTSFIATSLNSSATYYFFVFAANKNCTGGTKYLTASPLTGNATTTNAPLNNYYFGNLHAHTDYSDGQKDNPGGKPSDAYEYASASMGMDFLGISEHNHFSTLNNPGNQIANYHLGTAQANAFNATHPNFLALYGMEWGVISGGGHVLVYGDQLSELFGWESNVNGTVGPNYDIYVPKSTYLGVEGLFARVNDFVAKNAFASLAHPNNTDYNNLSNIAYDAAADSAISGVAVESGPATSVNTTYSNPSTMSYLWYYNKLLSKGYHLGPMIDHDNHNTTFGRHTPARTAVIAPALTQAELIKAIRNMHFYATEDMDSKVDFTINTRIMGSVFEDRNAPSIAVNLTDATNTTTGAMIRVMYGEPGSNINPVVIDSALGSSLSYVDNALANHATGYYYIDITNNGKRIVTSPIWYTRTCASASDTTANVCGSFNWYGTVYTTSTTATKVFSTTGGCDSTVTLHLVISNPPSAVTLAVAGSGDGCPGTGVGLTASANDTAIASYQWIQDGNVVATTSAGTYTATASGNYTVNAYNAGNCSVGSNAVSVTVSDHTAPVVTVPVLPVITGSCSATVTSAPTATDNCAGLVTGTTNDPLTYTVQGTHTIHWTFNDGNGNTTTQEQTVVVADMEKPTITAPGSFSMVNDEGQCGATINDIGTPVTADNCGVASVTNNHPSTFYPVGTTVVTWKVTDVNGNVTDTATQTITVIDNELPTISVTNISVSNTPGRCDATVTLAAPVTADNCGVAGVTNDHPSTIFPVGTTNVTWTVTDNNGWTNTVVQTVTVTDTERPVVTAPGEISVLNEAGQCGAHVNIGTPVVSDNCGVASVTNDHPSTYYPVGTTVVRWSVTDSHGNVTDTATQKVTVMDNELPTITLTNMTKPADAGCGANLVLLTPPTSDNCGVASVTHDHPSPFFPVGNTTVTWTVTDNHGWTTTGTQIITVTDQQAPVLVTQPVTVYLDAAGTATLTALQVIASVSDNCTVGSYSVNKTSFNCTNLGANTVTVTATDASGNSISATAVVTVKDNMAPTLTTQPITAYLNAAGSATITASQLIAASGDNCGIGSYAVSKTSFNCTNLGANTVTVTATDASGNSVSTTAVVTVKDNTAPTLTTQPITVYLNAAGTATITASQLIAASGDNCGISSYNVSKTSFNCTNLGSNTVTVTATDASGNSVSATAVVTVKDNTAPTLTTQPITVYLNAAGTATITASQLIAASGDNCGISSYSASKTSFNCTDLGTNTVAVTATDASGNSVSATAVVTVKDNSAPTLTTQPVTIYLNAAGSATITASQLIAASGDNCGISSYTVSKTSFSCSNLGANTVTVTATDASGNSSNGTAVVTVKDNTAPVVTAVPAQTFCTSGTVYTIPVLTATDNCSAVTTSYVITGATSRSGSTSNASGTFNAGSSIITWTVKDASGNTATSTTTVSISALPAATITAGNADAFCNKLTLTANTAGAGATYKWTSGTTTVGTTQALSLGQANSDGLYQVTVTLNGCTSAPATYNYQKQNLISSYTILAFNKVDLGISNIVASGSIGVTDAKGEVELGSFSTVSSPGSFVKAKNIDKQGLFISISNPIYAAATGITLPTMLLNTANTNNLPGKEVAQNSVGTVSGNYKSLTLKKGSRTTLTGTVFGSIRVEQGAQVTFTAPTISIDKLEVVKGPRNGYSYVRFSGDAKVLVSTSVTIGSQVFINPDNNNVTFYMGDKKPDDERFVVNGGDTKVNANVYVPKGKLKVTGGYRYGDYGFGLGDCDRDDDEERYFGQGSAFVNMTGTFIAENITGNGKNVIWNSFDCNAAPVQVTNAIQPVITQSSAGAENTITGDADLKVTVLPNPSTTYFSLKIESRYETPVNIRVMDSRGRVVDAKSKVGANSTIQLGHGYAGGTYFAELTQGAQRKVVQLIKVRG